MSIGEICNREVIIAKKQDSILEIAQLMRAHHVGSIVVIEEIDGSIKKPAGIITDRDLVIEIMAKQADMDMITAGDIMSFDLVVARESDGIWETMQLMRQHGVRRIPVVNDKESLIGILTADDLVELFSGEMNDLARIIRQEQHLEQIKRE